MFLELFWIFVITLPVLLFISPNLRSKCVYYYMYSLYALIMFFGSTFYIIRFMFKGPCYENAGEFNNIYRLSRWFLGLQPRIYGRETYDDTKQCIFVVNHQSFIDVLSLSDLWRDPSSVIAKDTLKYLGPLGLILYYTKIVLIKRTDRDKAIHAMREAAEQVKRDKINMFMFPEGTRCDTGRLMPFKKGAFYLAIQTQVPIQPIVISCYNSFLDHKNKRFEPTPYGVYLLPQISTANLTEDDAGKLLEDTFAAMQPIFELTASATSSELADDLRLKLPLSTEI